MLDAELVGREMKKTPVVEWAVPRRIFTKAAAVEEGMQQQGEGDGVLVKLWDFS